MAGDPCAEQKGLTSDWMAPNDLMSYGINHSDALLTVDANQTVRFVSDGLPDFYRYSLTSSFNLHGGR